MEFGGGVSLPIKNKGRSMGEKLFLALFLPSVVLFYVAYKWPQWLGRDWGDFYLLGKSLGFWYMTVYTAIVCGIAGRVLWSGENLYKSSKKKGPLSRYQRGKFTSIFLVQLIGFYLIPFVVAPLLHGQSLLVDPVKPASRVAHVYVSPAFLSWGMAAYIFGLIPLSVVLFGKRYCSWFCACGNLAETVGTTRWGTAWVRHHTPRGQTARKLESLQTICLVFALVFGVVLLLDAQKLISASTAVRRLQATQDIAIDLVFGALIGVGAYPFLGTRVWCRYGCPLAKLMELVGRWGPSRFAVEANSRCKGLGLCTQACPMGIDVASYAHQDKQPTEGSFGLAQTPCIGCGGCIEICPVDALQFRPVAGRGPGSAPGG